MLVSVLYRTDSTSVNKTATARMQTMLKWIINEFSNIITYNKMNMEEKQFRRLMFQRLKNFETNNISGVNAYMMLTIDTNLFQNAKLL